MKGKRRRYGEGTWFCVTLPKGGYAIGLIARGSERTSSIFGYFFGPRRAAIPELATLPAYTPEDAVMRRLFGDLHLHDGKWPILGSVPNWNRLSWPIPPLVQKDYLTGRVYEVIHDDSDDPGEELSRTLTSLDNPGPANGMLGAGAVELLLDRLLPPL